MSRIFGNINQIGYVVRDIHTSMDQWVRLGVGPWFYIEDVVTDYFRYRGADSDLKMSVALANSGDVQLELIQQRNDASSMYKEFLDSGRQGAQHIAYWTNDFQGLYDRALAAGYTVAQEGSIGGEQGRFAYLDTEFDQGTVVEISDISGPKGEMFDYVRESAANWDGAEPIRVLG
ncbi:VOC family protein [Mycobacterium vicinigordonae]|uniref:VOC family protein n=1 Tax=Mycobacterium vicinigordonae TaxID=1719132 RepID=A0A7D6DVC6_9MYCO|nr:VOC family protein [Mycobacterium vicinigordonae]QLL05704.1 VOC family protein [Mycobacterium vicinigordonae]